jgi:hypothetical protein
VGRRFESCRVHDDATMGAHVDIGCAVRALIGERKQAS